MKRTRLKLILKLALYPLAGSLALSLLWIGFSVVYVRTLKESQLAYELLDPATNHKIFSQVSRFLGTEGTGVLARPAGSNLYITNDHVREGSCNSQICDDLLIQEPERNDQDRVYLEILYCDSDKDLFFLKKDNESLVFDPDSLADPKAGETVYYYDWYARNNDSPYLHSAKILEVRDDFFIFEGTTRNGLSGSPLFNSEGQIVGILQSKGWRYGTPIVSALAEITHYFLFDWSSSSRGKAMILPPADWFSLTEEQKVHAEWDHFIQSQRNFQYSCDGQLDQSILERRFSAFAKSFEQKYVKYFKMINQDLPLLERFYQMRSPDSHVNVSEFCKELNQTRVAL